MLVIVKHLNIIKQQKAETSKNKKIKTLLFHDNLPR